MTLGAMILPQLIQAYPPNGKLQDDTGPIRSDLLPFIGISPSQRPEERYSRQTAQDHVPTEEPSLSRGMRLPKRNNRKAQIQLKPSQKRQHLKANRRSCEGVEDLIRHCQTAAVC